LKLKSLALSSLNICKLMPHTHSNNNSNSNSLMVITIRDNNLNTNSNSRSNISSSPINNNKHHREAFKVSLHNNSNSSNTMHLHHSRIKVSKVSPFRSSKHPNNSNLVEHSLSINSNQHCMEEKVASLRDCHSLSYQWEEISFIDYNKF